MKRRLFNRSSKLSRTLLIAFVLFITFTMAGGGIYLNPSVGTVAKAQDDSAPIIEPNTGTFTNSAQITFTDDNPFPSPATPYPSTINVTGQGGITKVTVTLSGINHDFPDDIEILLVGPGGQKVTLMGDNGGGNDLVNVNLTFDDAAANSLPDSTQIVSGTFKPTYLNTGTSGFPAPAPVGPYTGLTSLAVFNGTQQNGIWSLYVVDDANDTAPPLNRIASGWSITITAPTAAEMGAIAARSRADGQSVVKWTTGYESENLGFNVYREAAGGRVRLNKQLIAGSAFLSSTAMTAGRTYRWRDQVHPGKSDARYFIEEIDLNGESKWHGPILTTDIQATIKDVDFDLAQSATVDELGGSAPEATAAMEMRATQPGLMSAMLAGKGNVAGQAGVRMLVKREGLYRVTQEELAAAGFNMGVDPRFIQLFAGGREYPISVIGGQGGRLHAGDAIEFYGVGLDSPWTDAQAYWLVAGSQAGRRINASPSGRGPAAEGSFPYTIERKDRSVYFSSLRNGDRENFFGAVVGRAPVDQGLRVSSLSPRGGGGELEVSLQGVTLAQHDVGVSFNDRDLGVISFKDQEQGFARFSIDQALLREGDNVVRLAGGGERDVSVVDHIRLTYRRDYRAENNSLAFTANAGEQVTIDGFTGSGVRVFDVTQADAGVITELMGSISSRDGASSVTVSATGAGTRRLLAFTSDLVRKPAALAAYQPAGLRQKGWKADFVIISRKEFFDALKPLKKLRQSQGLKVEIVDVEAIFNEFSFGNKSPQAIKDFLAYAQSSWKRAPRFVMFAGDASFDPKNYLGAGDFDLVPTKLVDTDFMETASDEWFGDFKSEGLAQLAIGRLPVRTAEEAARIVAKIVAYDQSRPSDEILLVADRGDGYDFAGLNSRLGGAIPSGFKVEQIKRSSTDDLTARAQVLEALNRGPKVVNYTGHGSTNLWRGDILSADDAPSLTNRESLSFFVMMTCLNAYFHDAAGDSLGEALFKSDGGAIAVWASTGMTMPTSQAIISQDLLQSVLGAGGRALTLGEATMKAKSSMADMDVRRTWVLLGDPTTRLR
ncbi:MAG TPA: C25 family cysteine peptidase [Blastocatellia bacterium]|nr:C25 family cysteine peptidase [Blastocatellia bacterium]